MSMVIDSSESASHDLSVARHLAVFPGKDLAIWPIPAAVKNVYCLLETEFIIPP